MVEPSAAFLRLERRARQVRAIGWAGATVIVGSAVAMLFSELYPLVSQSVPYSLLIALMAPVLSATAGYIVGSRRPVQLPTILLRADVALGLDARLTTLYGIRLKPSKSHVARRIAAGLPSTRLDHRRALPLRVPEVSLVSGGALLAVVAIVLAALPPREPTVDEAFAEPAEVVVVDTPATLESQHASSGQVLAPAGPESSPSSALADLLAELRPQDAAEAERVDTDSVEHLLPRVRADVPLEEILRDIEGRLTDETAKLSASDVATLEALQRAASGPLAEALEEILKATSRRGILDRIAEIFGDDELLRQGRDLQVAATESPRGIQPGHDERTATLDTAASGSTAGEDVSMVPGQQGTAFPMFDTSSDQPGPPVLVGAALPSTIGEQGAYTYYLTKGVPIELPSEPTEPTSRDWSLNYEQVESIVSSRALSDEVLESVRAYFRRITEGGS
jgi:hypothetical protein